MIFYAIFNARCYVYDSPKIVAELNKIAATITLSTEEKGKLNKRIEEFKNAPKELLINCEIKDCDCGENN